MVRYVVLVCVAASMFLGSVGAAVYEELIPGYSRMKSSVMARKIVKPTMANLDFAAYNNNPIR
ncbi:MAG: hypothetical protein JW795_16590, partial [Chitinivibrionales bacterium]|nr:hypothetical protein [Chitinivibrionales bacterium]